MRCLTVLFAVALGTVCSSAGLAQLMNIIRINGDRSTLENLVQAHDDARHEDTGLVFSVQDWFDRGIMFPSPLARPLWDRSTIEMFGGVLIGHTNLPWIFNREGAWITSSFGHCLVDFHGSNPLEETLNSFSDHFGLDRSDIVASHLLGTPVVFPENSGLGAVLGFCEGAYTGSIAGFTPPQSLESRHEWPSPYNAPSSIDTGSFSVPEPSTFALLATLLSALAIPHRRSWCSKPTGSFRKSGNLVPRPSGLLDPVSLLKSTPSQEQASIFRPELARRGETNQENRRKNPTLGNPSSGDFNIGSILARFLWLRRVYIGQSATLMK